MIHCIITRNGERIPRPLATELHGQKTNEVIHMDYLYMGLAEKTKLKYVLVLKNDLTSYSWMMPFENLDGEAVVLALSKWITAFGRMEWPVSEIGPHFTESLVQRFTEESCILHHLLTPYCPWANGTVERLCKEVFRASRALLNEWRMSPTNRPAVIHCIQAIINQTPLKRFGVGRDASNKRWKCHMEAFAGLQPKGLVLQPLGLKEFRHQESLEEQRAREITHMDDVHTALEHLHKEVADNNKSLWTKAQRLYNSNPNLFQWTYTSVTMSWSTPREHANISWM